MTKLPIRLEHEPLVDAIFELRLRMGAGLSLADILPGVLFHELDNPKPTITRLPAANIPQPMRANDPSLQFAPSLRLDWGRFIIAVGDGNVVISCKLPYPGWPEFKSAILDIVGRIAKVDLQGSVDRYSLKYVNVIQAPSFVEQLKKMRVGIRLGDVEVENDHVSLQVHRMESGITHILSVVTGAKGEMPDGRTVFGAIVDVDSIQGVTGPSILELSGGLEEGLEKLRQANKAKFFGCLTDETIVEMGPIYE